jgi:hypothetical protein
MAPSPAGASTVVHHHTHIHCYEQPPPPSRPEQSQPQIPSFERKPATTAGTPTDESTLEELGRGLRGGLDQLRQNAQDVLRRLQQAEKERARLQGELVEMS